MATEISTWEELLATQVGTDYIWTGGNLNFDEIQPNGFDSTIVIAGRVDFNGAVFLNFRSINNTALSRGSATDSGQYWKNLTFQNIEHIVSTNTYGAFITVCPNFIENIVITGNITCPSNVTSRYVLLSKYQGQGLNNRFNRIGTNIAFKGDCSFFLGSESSTADPYNVNRLPFYDCRFILDLEYNSTKSPFSYYMYNCKIAGKVKNNNTTATELAMNPYYCAISLESNKDINCPNLNLVRSDLATYASNPQLVRCDSPFWEHKADITASGFPYGE